MTEPSIVSRNQFDRANAAVAIAVWLFSLIIYTITKAPTLSFWDCGEFIAAGAILGIPHPPGSPLYIVVARLFSELPLWADVGTRINFLSGVCSAFAAMFGYLVVVRLLRAWFDTASSAFNRAVVYGGGMTGALFAAFSLTNWNNSVEAEVYGMTMMIMFAIIWLALLHKERQGTPAGDRFMLLAVFLAFLGVGVHMSVYLALPIAALFFVLRKGAPSWAWFLVAVYIGLELYLIFALSSRPGEVSYFVPVLIVGLLYFLYVLSFERVPRVHLLVGAGFLLSLLPVFGTALSLFGSAVSQDIRSSLTTVGVIIFILLNLAALYLVLQYTRRKREVDNPAHFFLIPAAFVGAATLMVLLLQVFKGYKPFLLITALLAVLLVYLIRRYLRWEILITIVAASTLIIGVKPFLFAILIAGLALALMGLGRIVPGWKNGLLILLAALMGFSINAFIPVRARQQPNINENDATTISATISFIDRKQYVRESMVERMFTRRAEWENQFGNYRRMGFWRFFHEQYGFRGPATVFLILLGIFGAWEIVRRKPKLGLAVVLLLLLCSVGLVLYMNFADGTRQSPVTGQDYLEVRDRDYFFTPAFMLFGLCIGIGLTFMVHGIRTSLERASGGMGKTVGWAALVLFAAPVIPLAGNYHYADRSGNYIPYDYGRNLLMSAEPNGILFSHGDNDTFPLWCLQEAYGMRTDIAVVNLSLANTHWYIRQLRDIFGLELPWTDEEINQMRAYRDSNGQFIRPQDHVVDALVDRYYGERPLYFTVTTGSSARRYKGQPLDSRLRMTGLLFQIGEPSGRIDVDVQKSLEFFLGGGFQARGIADPDVYMDEATSRLTANYGNAFLMVADTLRRAGDVDMAKKVARRAIEKIPHATDPVDFLAKIFAQQRELDSLKLLLESTDTGDPKELRLTLARAVIQDGDTARGLELMQDIVRDYPNDRAPIDDMLRLQYFAKDYNGMRNTVELWLRFNPDDDQMRELARELRSGVRGRQDTLGDSAQ